MKQHLASLLKDCSLRKRHFDCCSAETADPQLLKVESTLELCCIIAHHCVTVMSNVTSAGVNVSVRLTGHILRCG